MKIQDGRLKKIENYEFLTCPVSSRQVLMVPSWECVWAGDSRHLVSTTCYPPPVLKKRKGGIVMDLVRRRLRRLRLRRLRLRRPRVTHLA